MCDVQCFSIAILVGNCIRNVRTKSGDSIHQVYYQLCIFLRGMVKKMEKEDLLLSAERSLSHYLPCQDLRRFCFQFLSTEMNGSILEIERWRNCGHGLLVHQVFVFKYLASMLRRARAYGDNLSELYYLPGVDVAARFHSRTKAFHILGLRRPLLKSSKSLLHFFQK